MFGDHVNITRHLQDILRQFSFKKTIKHQLHTTKKINSNQILIYYLIKTVNKTKHFIILLKNYLISYSLIECEIYKLPSNIKARLN